MYDLCIINVLFRGAAGFKALIDGQYFREYS